MTEEAKRVKVEPVPVNVMIEEVIKRIEELEQKGTVPIEEYLAVLEKVKALQERLNEEKLISFNVDGLKERLSKIEIIWHTVEPEEAEKILSLKDYDERLEEGINLLLEIAKDPIGISLLSSFNRITLQQIRDVYNELKRYVKKEDIEKQLSKIDESIATVKEVAKELKEEKDKVISEIKEAGEQVKNEVLTEVREDIDVIGTKIRELERRIGELEADTSETNERVTGLVETLNRRLEETKQELYNNIVQNPDFKIEIKELIEEVLNEKGTAGIDIEAVKRELKEEIMAEVLSHLKKQNETISHESEEEESESVEEDVNWEEEVEEKEEEKPEEKTVEKKEDKSSNKNLYINLGIIAVDVILIIEILSSLL